MARCNHVSHNGVSCVRAARRRPRGDDEQNYRDLFCPSRSQREKGRLRDRRWKGRIDVPVLVLTRALELARSDGFSPKEEGKIEKPSWLGMHGNEHYILKERITVGQEYHETKQSTTDTYARRVAIGNGADPARDDFATFVVITLYKIMTTKFRDNRRRLREEFSVYFGFLFKKWDEYNLFVSDESLDMRWAKSFAEMTRLPEDSVKICMVEDAGGQDADLWSRTVYNHMKNDKSLRLLVGHDILLAKGTEGEDHQRVHAGGKQGRFRYFRRWLSMIVPATVLFTGWADMPSNMEAYKVLRHHPKKMQVIYSTALLLRDVFDLHPDRAIRDGMNSQVPSGRKLTGTASERELVASFFSALLPGKSLLTRAMDRATVAVSDNLYQRLHVPTVREKELQAQLARAKAAPGTPSQEAGEADHRTARYGTKVYYHNRKLLYCYCGAFKYRNGKFVC